MSVVAFVGRVVVYTITGCPHCLAAKALLRDKSIPYLEVGALHEIYVSGVAHVVNKVFAKVSKKISKVKIEKVWH